MSEKTREEFQTFLFNIRHRLFWVPRTLSIRLKGWECKADHSPPDRECVKPHVCMFLNALHEIVLKYYSSVYQRMYS
jgi:hypothetical protein